VQRRRSPEVLGPQLGYRPENMPADSNPKHDEIELDTIASWKTDTVLLSTNCGTIVVQDISLE